MSDERHTISADEKVQELFAENARLREALEEAEQVLLDCRATDSVMTAIKRARAALAKEGQ